MEANSFLLLEIHDYFVKHCSRIFAIWLYGIDTAIQTKISTTTRFLDKDRVSDSRDGSIEGKTRI
jgi:hypothetical protein